MLPPPAGRFGYNPGGFAPLRASVDVKFAVRYPGGAVHEIVIDGHVAVVGRDPSCDLVLNDPKSSRRHAVVEDGPDGLVIRDTGSANGISVNGKKTERSPLRTGDVFRIGDVEVTILGEQDAGTLVMDELGPEAVMGAMPPRTATLPPLDSFPAPPPDVPAVPARTPAEGVPGPPTGRATTTPRGPAFAPPPARPLTVAVLAVLWALSVPLYAVTAIALLQARPGTGGMAMAAVSAALTILSGLMAYGLWTAQAWARPVQIAVAALGILVCPFSLAAIAVLAYMLRPPARRYFTRVPGDTTGDQSEAIFAAAVVAAVVLGGVITAFLTIVARTARTGLP
jgi:hypothetical protein